MWGVRIWQKKALKPWALNQFKRLKDDPVNAAKALDNELHFLTATQLEQIWRCFPRSTTSRSITMARTGR
ncbi:phage tail length tape measure family protein [Escherichia coli]|uniref:phage tail length tape measure family protein n=1 Tax=Escherichia coli TaxID=562 RepID=UPI003B01E5F5